MIHCCYFYHSKTTNTWYFIKILPPTPATPFERLSTGNETVSRSASIPGDLPVVPRDGTSTEKKVLISEATLKTWLDSPVSDSGLL